MGGYEVTGRKENWVVQYTQINNDMRKIVIFAFFILLFTACEQSVVDKANVVISNSSTYKTIGTVDKVDSVFGYKDAYRIINIGREESWRIDSTLEANKNKISISQRDILLQRAKNAYNLKTMAIKINIKHELSGLKKDFVGFSATKVDQKCTYTLFFDKDLRKVLGVDVIRE